MLSTLAIFFILPQAAAAATSKGKEGEVDNVRVAIRLRPLSDKELQHNMKVVVKLDQLSGQVTVHNPKPHGESERTFTFDTVLGPDTKQVDIYNETARPIVESVLEGYNGELVWKSEPQRVCTQVHPRGVAFHTCEESHTP